jgi:hypothetical protein
LGVSYALFALMGLVTASFTLTWACAKEVNPPLLSGMSTSVTNMGGFPRRRHSATAGGLGDGLDLAGGSHGSRGASVYAAGFPGGLLLLAGTASFGALASWSIRETRCRNIWQPPV